ncbi:hypothetical protein BDR05DRAFT_997178 [Suillus weaverae]|nr:hypothetical protein BDR05DRAFT_997178 [Suillus weaverae]
MCSVSQTRISTYSSLFGHSQFSLGFKGHTESNKSLAWMPDGTCLLTGGNNSDATIHKWDTTTWQQCF